MSSQLEDKLREVLVEIICDGDDALVEYNDGGVFPTDKALELLRQAFSEAGYYELPVVIEETKKLVKDVPRRSAYPVMTGQEFYDRFEKELGWKHEILKPANSTKIITEVKEAAKRAAGIEEPKSTTYSQVYKIKANKPEDTSVQGRGIGF